MAKICPYLLVLVCSVAVGENWPQWRGPQNDGVSTATGIPMEWSQTENVVWRTPLPGPAGATPVVWDDKIFVSSIEGNDLVLLGLSTDGEILWKRKVGTGNKDARGGEGNSASPSPCTDGELVWIFFGTGHLACFTVDGEPVWDFNVQDRYGRFDIQFGMTSTPVLHDDALFLQLIHGTMRDDYTVGKIIKLNKRTGEEIWAVDRPSDAKFECKHSYASPFLYDDGETQFLVTHGADYTAGHSLEDGKELWRFEGLNGPSPYNTGKFDPTFRFVSSPGISNGSIVIPTAKAGPTIALKVSDALQGDVTEEPAALRWFLDKTPDVSIPLIHDGLVYFFRKDGRVFCCDLETGKEHYYERTHTAQHRSSPIYVDGHLIWCAKDGHCTVLKAGPEFEIVSEIEMNEPITASPIVANGTLYLRTYDALYAIRSRDSQ
ncbi:PQQ-binding-like beta-propeller repeat protein [Thalassoglobus sp. JC818]|uniref:PQQ-binding-like beta-propeller repeat protein n=1 Tax=Thalassoglobus sp. JC818 TaxID=3232136 RepID=UPI00345ADB68